MEAPSILRTADFAPGDLSTRARAVAAIAANNAIDVDASSRFPAEACAALKEQRLLGVMVSRDLGGEGASIADVADVCYLLGQACASTAMIYAMHQIKVACVTRHMRDNARVGKHRCAACAPSSCCWRPPRPKVRAAATCAPARRRSSTRTVASRLERTRQRHFLRRLRRRYRDHGAPFGDAAGSDQVLVAFLKSDYTLTRLQGWNTLGMRGTCSEGYTLKATGQAGQILPDPYEMIHAQTMVPFAHLLWGSVWTGIAAGATSRAQAFIRQAMRTSNGQLPPGAPQFTKALKSLRTLRGMLATSLRAYERSMNDPKALASVEFQSMITLTKVEASELAVSIVMSAMRACGLSGYRSDGDFSIGRHLRDVLSSPIMINNDRILANLATSSLMTPIPASMRD